MLLIIVLLAVIPAHILANCSINDRRSYLQEQARLYKSLLKDYDSRLSAVTTQDNSSLDQDVDLPRYEVSVIVVFMKMIRMVEAEQKLDFLFEYATEWTDERLEWNASEFCGIEHIYIAMSDIWVPEVTIVDAHLSEDYREDYKKFVRVNSSGFVEFFVPTRTSTICTIEVHDFPFDQQECEIKIMGQSFSALEYGIKAKLIDSISSNSSFIHSMGNGEWEVRNVSVRSWFIDNGDKHPAEMKIIGIILKRNASFFVSMVIIPSFVINVLSIFGVFIRTADSMGKLGMALTNVMSLTFILGILATALPKTKDLPKIAIYVIVNLSVMVFAVTITLVLPYLRQYLDRGSEIVNNIDKKKKRTEGKLFKAIHIGLFVMLEIANLINFIILIM